MTPDEIKVAIRMLDQIVVYDDLHQVLHTDKGYVVRSPGCDRPLFGKDGDFSRNWAGYKMFGPHKFKVVKELPKRPRRSVARK